MMAAGYSRNRKHTRVSSSFDKTVIKTALCNCAIMTLMLTLPVIIITITLALTAAQKRSQISKCLKLFSFRNKD